MLEESYSWLQSRCVHAARQCDQGIKVSIVQSVVQENI